VQNQLLTANMLEIAEGKDTLPSRQVPADHTLRKWKDKICQSLA
jgi:hypothetical protein